MRLLRIRFIEGEGERPWFKGPHGYAGVQRKQDLWPPGRPAAEAAEQIHTGSSQLLQINMLIV
jgi:hypothetical protein